MTGCATPPTGFVPGWRTGSVTDIVEGKDIGKGIKGGECVAALSASQITQTQFAVVRYHQGRKSRPRVVPLPVFTDLRVGDKVRINIIDCASPISRILPEVASTDQADVRRSLAYGNPLDDWRYTDCGGQWPECITFTILVASPTTNAR